MLAINGASAALSVSDIPWHGPIAAVRVARVDGEFITNPTHDQRKDSDLDLVYVGNENDLVMIEGAGQEISEADMMKARRIRPCRTPRRSSPPSRNSRKRPGKPKRQVKLYTVSTEIQAAATELIGGQILGRDSHARASSPVDAAVDALKEKMVEASQDRSSRDHRLRDSKKRSTRFRTTPSAIPSSMTTSVPTAAARAICVRCTAKSASSPALTAPPFSNAAKRRPWS